MLHTSLVPRILLALLVAAYIGLGYITFLLFFPFATISVNNEPFPIKNNPVTAGSVLIYVVDYCRYTDVGAEVTRTLVGNVTIAVGKTDTHFQKGCHKVTIADPQIPNFTPPGKYHIQLDVIYSLNSLRTVDKHFTTATFEVIAPAKPKEETPPSQTPESSVIQGTLPTLQQINPPIAYIPPQTKVGQPPVTQPPKSVPPPVVTPPTTSSPPPTPTQHGVSGIVKRILNPINGVLDAIGQLIHP